MASAHDAEWWACQPDWARYCAQAADGKWYVFEDKPEIFGRGWENYKRWALAFDRLTWEDTLEARP